MCWRDGVVLSGFGGDEPCRRVDLIVRHMSQTSAGETDGRDIRHHIITAAFLTAEFFWLLMISFVSRLKMFLRESLISKLLEILSLDQTIQKFLELIGNKY